MGGELWLPERSGRNLWGTREFQEDILVGDMFGSGEERVWLWGELGRIRVSNASRQKKGSPCFLP